MTTTEKISRKFKGIVVSAKMNKTAVVRIDRVKIHPKYKKRFQVSKRYKVHDEKNELAVGDKIIFEECRPLSKEKRWRFIEKI